MSGDRIVGKQRVRGVSERCRRDRGEAVAMVSTLALAGINGESEVPWSQ